MIEEIIKEYLDEKLSVPAFMEKPSDKPKKYILIDRTGGTKSNHLPSATIAFQSYAESKYAAAVLNEELKNTMELMVGELHEIRGITLNSDYDYTDATKKEYRYQAVYDIRYY